MTFEKNIQKYAKLIVTSGLNVQPKQILVIEANIEAAVLVRAVTKEAYEIGAKEVVVRYSDEVVTKMKYEYGDTEIFSQVPTWVKEFRNGYARENAAFLTITSEDPEALKDVDGSKISTYAMNLSKATKEFRDSLNLGINSWCIVGASSVKWANKVFPDMSDEEAKEALWNAIFKTAKVDQENPIEAWKQHRQSFERRVKYLNELQLQSLTFTNAKGTNITVDMVADYLFAGGGSYLTNGLYTFPNIPTEEIFTSPMRGATNGIVYSSMPLSRNGNVIDEFYLEFKDGRVINYDAKVGKETLKEIIEFDEGSHYLGEVALVPYDSPISNMNTLFYSTLYDENAACHFAIGIGFNECIKNGLTMTKEQLLEKGINDSLTHVDFMIGTSDLKIVGTTKTGQKVDIFVDGNFVF